MSRESSNKAEQLKNAMAEAVVGSEIRFGGRSKPVAVTSRTVERNTDGVKDVLLTTETVRGVRRRLKVRKKGRRAYANKKLVELQYREARSVLDRGEWEVRTCHGLDEFEIVELGDGIERTAEEEELAAYEPGDAIGVEWSTGSIEGTVDRIEIENGGVKAWLDVGNEWEEPSYNVEAFGADAYERKYNDHGGQLTILSGGLDTDVERHPEPVVYTPGEGDDDGEEELEADGGEPEAEEELATESDSTLALVGCGASKNDPSEEGKRDLMASKMYASNYFRLKREFGALECDSWRVLSALHGVIDPWCPITPYDHTMSDKTAEEAAEWGADVIESLRSGIEYRIGHEAHEPLTEIVVLAGAAYVEPIRDGLAAIGEEFGIEISYPFDSTSGIGEQMALLKERTSYANEAGETYESEFAEELAERRADLEAEPEEGADESVSQDTVYTDGGTPEVEGAGDWLATVGPAEIVSTSYASARYATPDGTEWSVGVNRGGRRPIGWYVRRIDEEKRGNGYADSSPGSKPAALELLREKAQALMHERGPWVAECGAFELADSYHSAATWEAGFATVRVEKTLGSGFAAIVIRGDGEEEEIAREWRRDEAEEHAIEAMERLTALHEEAAEPTVEEIPDRELAEPATPTGPAEAEAAPVALADGGAPTASAHGDRWEIAEGALFYRAEGGTTSAMIRRQIEAGEPPVPVEVREVHEADRIPEYREPREGERTEATVELGELSEPEEPGETVARGVYGYREEPLSKVIREIEAGVLVPAPVVEGAPTIEALRESVTGPFAEWIRGDVRQLTEHVGERWEGGRAPARLTYLAKYGTGEIELEGDVIAVEPKRLGNGRLHEVIRHRITFESDDGEEISFIVSPRDRDELLDPDPSVHKKRHVGTLVELVIGDGEPCRRHGCEIPRRGGGGFSALFCSDECEVTHDKRRHDAREARLADEEAAREEDHDLVTDGGTDRWIGYREYLRLKREHEARAEKGELVTDGGRDVDPPDRDRHEQAMIEISMYGNVERVGLIDARLPDDPDVLEKAIRRAHRHGYLVRSSGPIGEERLVRFQPVEESEFELPSPMRASSSPTVA